MRRIPRQSHRPPTALIPLNSRPLAQPLAPNFRIRRQRKERRPQRLSVVLREAIPGAPDLRRRVQALGVEFMAERDGRRPGPTLGSIVVGNDMDWRGSRERCSWCWKLIA